MMNKQKPIDICGILPLTKKEIVFSKYLLIFLSNVIGTSIGVILSIIIAFITTKQFINIKEILVISSGAILGISFIDSIEIPFFYKFGMEKGRICSILAVIMCGLGAGIFTTFKINISIQYLPIIFTLLTFILFSISYFISYKIYKNKEL